MLKGLGNLQELMQQAQKLSAKMESMKQELAGKRETATAGGGMVEVTVNGQMELESVKIDPAIVKEADRKMLEDLVVAATNEALRRMQAVAKETMSKATGGFSIPGLQF